MCIAVLGAAVGTIVVASPVMSQLVCKGMPTDVAVIGCREGVIGICVNICYATSAGKDERDHISCILISQGLCS